MAELASLLSEVTVASGEKIFVFILMEDHVEVSRGVISVLSRYLRDLVRDVSDLKSRQHPT